MFLSFFPFLTVLIGLKDFYRFIPYGTLLFRSAVSIRCGYAASFLLFPQIIASFLHNGQLKYGGEEHEKPYNSCCKRGRHFYTTTAPSCCIPAPFCHLSATLQTISIAVVNLQDNRAVIRIVTGLLIFSFDPPSYFLTFC